MIHAPAQVVAAYLVAQNAGAQPPLPAISAGVWPVFTNYMPPEGELAICTYDTTATQDGRLMKTGQGIYHPGVQIIVRAQDQEAVYAKAKAIHQLIEAVLNQTVVVEGVTYNFRNAAEISLPTRIGQEQGKERMLYSINFVVTIDQFQSS